MIDYTALAERVIQDCKYDVVAIIDNAVEATAENIKARAESIVKTAAQALYSHRKGADSQYTFEAFEAECESSAWDYLIVLMAENAIHRFGTQQHKDYSEGNIKRTFDSPRSYYVAEMQSVQRRAGVL